MVIFRFLVILFISVPLLELYLLIKVGSMIGVLPTVILCLFTAVLGAALLRHQGLQTLARVQEKVSRGEVPATDLLGGLMLLLCGAFLLTPGFFTDCIGFLCLVPAFRTWAATSILQQLLKKATVVSVNQSTTIDGEFWEEENKRIEDK